MAISYCDLGMSAIGLVPACPLSVTAPAMANGRKWVDSSPAAFGTEDCFSRRSLAHIYGDGFAPRLRSFDTAIASPKRRLLRWRFLIEALAKRAGFGLIDTPSVSFRHARLLAMFRGSTRLDAPLGVRNAFTSLISLR